jgi:hypothetical protein
MSVTGFFASVLGLIAQAARRLNGRWWTLHRLVSCPCLLCGPDRRLCISCRPDDLSGSLSAYFRPRILDGPNLSGLLHVPGTNLGNFRGLFLSIFHNVCRDLFHLL